jgi:peptidoglycan/LPS O-acetylase OafA/YrhL
MRLLFCLGKVPPAFLSPMKPLYGHLPFLDYLRGLAILGVVLNHSLYYSLHITSLPWDGEFRTWNGDPALWALFPALFGWIGVPMFFTVSGFCIHLSHRQSGERGFGIFFLRRFFRIYPPYLLALVLSAFVFRDTRIGWGIRTHDAAIFIHGLKQFLSHTFLVNNFSSDSLFGINPAFWSIAVEVQLYLIYPLLLWIAGRLGWRTALWVAASIELFSRSVNELLTAFYPSLEMPTFFSYSPFYFWFTWTMGAALAEAWMKGEPLPFRSAWGYLWPALFLICYFFKPLFSFCYPLAALASTHLIAYFLSRPPGVQKVRGVSGYLLEHLRWAGLVSYSAYLIHLPLLTLVPYYLWLISPRHYPAVISYGLHLCSWFPIFGLSYLMYRFVEKPSIMVGKRFIERLRRPASEPATEMAGSS